MGSVFYSKKERDGLMMGKVRNQKWICLCLAIAMMISGICLEKIPADSYFSYNQTSTITKSDRVRLDVSAYRTETLSQREVLSSLRTVKRELRRNQVRTYYSSGMCLFNAEILPPIFQIKQLAEVEGIYGNTSYSVAILSYIHNQDGEKA